MISPKRDAQAITREYWKSVKREEITDQRYREVQPDCVGRNISVKGCVGMNYITNNSFLQASRATLRSRSARKLRVLSAELTNAHLLVSERRANAQRGLSE